MAFDPNNKVSFDELATALLDYIKSKASGADFKDHVFDNTRHIMKEERDSWNAMLQSSKEYVDSRLDDVIGEVLDDETIAELLKSKVSQNEFDYFKKSLHTVAFSGDYVDIDNKPTTIAHATESDNTKTINNISIIVCNKQQFPPKDPKAYQTICILIDEVNDKKVMTLRLYAGNDEWIVCNSTII